MRLYFPIPEAARGISHPSWLPERILRFSPRRRTTELAPDDAEAHYNLALIYSQLANTEKAAFHRKEHEKYRPDDNARDRSIAIHRAKNPAADHAAQGIRAYLGGDLEVRTLQSYFSET